MFKIKRLLMITAASVSVLSLAACNVEISTKDDDDVQLIKPEPIEVGQLRFIGEVVLPDDTEVDGTTFGGISSIDYADGYYWMISDDANADDVINGPIRLYRAVMNIEQDSFDVAIDNVIELTGAEGPFAAGEVDPEALRFDPNSEKLIWTSEGFANSGVQPAVIEAELDGAFSRSFTVPAPYLVSDTSGTRHNTGFEGLSLSANGKGYWVALEGPLKQDGNAPTLDSAQGLIRIAYIDRATGQFGKTFTVQLDPITRQPAKPGFAFSVSGVVEVLEYQANQFLLLERSYATNYADGGNNVKVYQVDASNADDVSELTNLAQATIQTAVKTPLFDFESIRNQLTDGVVDNIEGMTFGPILASGNPSLVMVADNNFSLFGDQLNQFIAFEVLPEPAPTNAPIQVSSVEFVDEFIFDTSGEPELIEFDTIGGLSGIDYHNGTYFLISDDDNRDDSVQGPVRFYQAEIDFDDAGFNVVEITRMHEILTLDEAGNSVSFAERKTDPEAIRVDPINGNLVWVDEGQVSNGGVDMAIRQMGAHGEVVSDYLLPEHYLITEQGSGPRNNAGFEGLSISADQQHYWVAMESPLIQDGEPAQLADTVAPVRLALIDRVSGQFVAEYAYMLDDISRVGDEGAFRINGVVDVLAIDDETLLVLERSYTSGQSDGGNDVKLYSIDVSQATNVAEMPALDTQAYQAVDKTLLLNFNDFRSQLSTIAGEHIVDNIEGITFGPTFSDGSLSLLAVADDNFSLFGAQLNQFLLFKVNAE